jgi:hemoglobin-like flavoprotein
MKNYSAIFNDSFKRVGGEDREELYAAFYDRFITASPEVGAKFAGSDIKRQHRMLRQSLLHALKFSLHKTSSDFLESLAKLHGVTGLDIPARLYDRWMECLVESVQACDPDFDHQVELAWRVVLAPGIAFMKHAYRDASPTAA